MQIKSVETDKEVEELALVMWQTWQDTYKGIIDDNFWQSFTIKQCIKIAKKNKRQTLVAKINQTVIGFIAFGPYRDSKEQLAGEIWALYVQKKYHNQKIGQLLMKEALKRLNGFPKVFVWVLKENERAIRFYKRAGFLENGATKQIVLGDNCDEIQLEWRSIK
ncbi:GNAT family N-acetyltransferase [Vaginisenegalia massiliensis]|uniref:GNAT family N-acetyltransferase n=1 Tax=Vaginisenegalia massiliensis TaxID=2058294 RepID=UPI000F51D9D4|nr:GNAT family N-acetyltransferase [Vaginisenegalia massiliensis]